MGGIEACLDQSLPVGLRDERLEFRSRKSVDEAGFRYDKEEDLGAGEGG